MNMPGNQWIPPQQPPTEPFPPAHYPSGPLPAPAPPRNLGPLIIGGAVIVAGAIVATALVATRQGSGGHPVAASTTSASETSTAAPSASVPPTTGAPTGPTYQVVPQSMLPALADVSRLTGVTMTTSAAPALYPGTDDRTTPASCMFASDSVTQSTWKSARAMAGQRYVEGTFDSYNSSAAAALAVFAATGEAATSLSTVSGSVRGCTAFTAPDWNPKYPPVNWTVTDLDRGDDHITWSTTQGGGWVCRRSYRVVANLAANAVVCSDKAAAGAATALTDLLIANATKQ